MKATFLIQRLRKPFPDPANPLAIGLGGGEGLSREARKELRKIFEFDYMGSAEFEGREVLDALEKIWEERKDFVKGEVAIPLEAIQLDNWEKIHYEKKEGTGKVYLFCNKAHVEYVKNLVKKLAFEETSKTLQERSNLRYAFLKDKTGSDDRIAGWLELDNGFFFFTDDLMFTNTVKFFGMAELLV